MYARTNLSPQHVRWAFAVKTYLKQIVKAGANITAIMEIDRERLHDILSNIDAPLLNLGFFDADQQERIEKHFTERLPQRIINAIDDVEERFSQNKSSRSFFRNSSASDSSNSPLKMG